ncbi:MULTISPECIES: hypothetical protein [Chryseobacterium]|uniref:MlpB protein n=1 Tax=Chryseobacterium aquaticum subsp. greenlandense TaxID=345663 RepID=A0A101CHJ4_9FLAO|nr:MULTISPECIES: hypothetical protein [Chryseobacterium]KNB61169.1 MlpB protein [Chryseobacterium sp. Hurlbut01]KUJ56363.1 hypothetical protein AR686_07310 [Chryseobacterium aquaticum subsp. greenlandense]
MKSFLIVLSSALLLGLSSCGEKKGVTEDKKQSEVSSDKFVKGDIVPSNQVCMVNNAYMGKKQIEVKYNGKLYYGCCQMCEKRIPKEAEVRVAIDPISKKEVDKADAVIAITGDDGEVSYFENKQNYKAFIK